MGHNKHGRKRRLKNSPTNTETALQCRKCTVDHKSHDPCLHVFVTEAGIMTFVAHCTSQSCNYSRCQLVFFLDVSFLWKQLLFWLQLQEKNQSSPPAPHRKSLSFLSLIAIRRNGKWVFEVRDVYLKRSSKDFNNWFKRSLYLFSKSRSALGEVSLSHLSSLMIYSETSMPPCRKVVTEKPSAWKS